MLGKRGVRKGGMKREEERRLEREGEGWEGGRGGRRNRKKYEEEEME